MASGEDGKAQRALAERGPIPEHVAIIMDGNGRWAKERGRPRIAGHRAGVDSVRDVVEACAELGVGYLTLYTFSVENWLRPAPEVEALMALLRRALREELSVLQQNDIRLRAISDIGRLPQRTRGVLAETMDATSANRRMQLVLALSYSGRLDIVRGVRTLCRRARDGGLDPDAVGEKTVSDALFTAGMPDPDLLIRTGAESRVSNFLLWQLAYTELVMSDCYWPSFRRVDLYGAVRAYQDRERRFGRIPGQ